MRKLWKIFLLAGVLCAILCVGTLAAEATASGVYDVKTSTGYTLTPQTAGKVDITVSSVTINNAEEQFYANAERFTLTGPISDTGNQNLVFALKGDTAALGTSTTIPTENNIVYIDQKAADGNAVTFSIYPSALESGVTYGIYVVGTSTSYTKVASFSYYAPYVLGDVDADGKINSSDALLTLQKSVDLVELTSLQILAADVNGDENVNSSDALEILQYSVQLIESFSKE
mgnify:CR=1 FL=1